MREKLIELLNRWPCFGTAEEHADHLIANGVEIPVRCKDCKHFGGHGKCFYHAADENGTPIFVREDDFCSYGERRSE